jgi:hypothetical protein
MNHPGLTLTAALAALALLAAGCGDDGGGGTTAPTSTTAASTTSSASTTAATTTTEATTTTTSDAHPVWGISWASVWPREGSTATYRLALPDAPSTDLPATIEYGVAWDGGTWDRIVIGDPTPGEYGLAFYFDRSEPWVIRVWGVRATGPGMGSEG